MNKAVYECTKCNHVFEGDPGPIQHQAQELTECPLCNNMYVKWVNYGSK